MHILHISSDYPYTPLYRELLTQLSAEPGYIHTMYVPLAKDRVDRHYDYSAPNVRVIFSGDFARVDRFLYHRKRKRIQTAIERQVSLSDVKLVHAHYLFSAGGVAHAFKKSNNIRYVVAVRNSDVNYFFKYAIHLRRFGVEILRGASQIVFLSPAYQETVIQEYVPPRFRQKIREKSRVVPNGVHEDWIKNRKFGRRMRDPRCPRLVYAGQFTENKNLDASIAVTKRLRSRGYGAKITLVGDGPEAARVKQIADTNSDWIEVRPWAESREELMAVYRESDIYIMPSRAETFGLSYIEAMSQGLPVLFSRGQGVDGYFPNGRIGFACNPDDHDEMTDRVEQIIHRYEEISTTCTSAVDQFSWDQIARTYEAMYDDISSATEWDL